ncbi:MAG: zf-TFIIB domain-containing protein, partial [Planctomycetaceae bacterium]|nr:zf-TFIIB domain-containing protein [Planctomycetaceae bacterium]
PVHAFLGTLEEPERTQRGIANRPCPECQTIMALTTTYGIEVDVCRTHGVWFDHGELEAFFHSKDLMASELYQRRRQAERARVKGHTNNGGSIWSSDYGTGSDSSFGGSDSSSGWDNGIDE